MGGGIVVVPPLTSGERPQQSKWNRGIQSLSQLRRHLPLHKGAVFGAALPRKKKSARASAFFSIFHARRMCMNSSPVMVSFS